MYAQCVEGGLCRCQKVLYVFSVDVADASNPKTGLIRQFSRIYQESVARQGIVKSREFKGADQRNAKSNDDGKYTDDSDNAPGQPTQLTVFPPYRDPSSTQQSTVAHDENSPVFNPLAHKTDLAEPTS